MDKIYIEYQFKINPKEPATEILIAELGNLNFESFVETEEGLTAYIQKEDWHTNLLDEVFILQSKEFNIVAEYSEMAQTNWNAEKKKKF